MRLTFSDRGNHDLDALDPVVRHRILRKLEWFIRTDDPLVFAAPLSHHAFGDYRFRIGDWRVVVRVHGDTIIVSRIAHRSDIYR